MLVYKGGKKVGKGTYWNPADGHRVDVKDEGVLPGGERTNYLKMPPGGMLLVAPVVGLLYVVFLPVFGLMAIVGMWLVPLFGIVAGTALTGIKLCSGMFSTVGKSVSFGWTPTTAYLSGKKRARKKEDEEKKEEEK
jgi:hypothetical protein